MSQSGSIPLSTIGQYETEMFEDETLLVEECARGSRIARKVLYETHYTLLLGICIRYVGQQDDAEDILHESFIKIFKAIRKFRNNSKLSTWLSRIVINDCLAFLKKSKRTMLELTEDYAEPESETEPAYPGLERLSCDEIIRMLDALPQGYRTVLCLYSIDGWSHAEISRKLGIKESTSRSQLTKARRMFQEIIMEKRK